MDLKNPFFKTPMYYQCSQKLIQNSLTCDFQRIFQQFRSHIFRTSQKNYFNIPLVKIAQMQNINIMLSFD